MMTDEQELMAQIDATFVTGPAQPWLSVAGGSSGHASIGIRGRRRPR